MSTHAAVIDDRDPLIQYAGSWSEAGAAEEFDSTTTFSVAAGVTATVPFVGTSITVYGTVAARNLTAQPIWSFAVDGSAMSTYTPPDNMTSDVHHLALWTSPSSSIANGSHQLVVTQTRAPSDGASGVIFLDYIMFTTTSASVEAYFVDDRDPQIKYTPAWRQFGSEGDFQHTSQATSSVGDFLSYTFDGKAISFYGGMTSATTNASITIDGGPAHFWVPPTSASQTNNLAYSSGDLIPGTHTLVVTAENDQPVWADYFLVTPNPPGSVNPSSSASGSGTSSTSSPSASITSPPSHKSTPIGAIVGPIVGVLALIALAVAVFFCRRRRRDRNSPEDPDMSNANVNAAPYTGYSQYTASGAGPPPALSHGYSSEQMGPFAIPPDPHSSSNLATAGVSHNDPDSPNAASGSHRNASPMPSTSYPSVSHHAPSLSGTLTLPTSDLGSGSGSGASGSSEYGVPVGAPSGQTGIIPSNKLMREAERARQWHVSTAGSVAGGPEMPPHYSE
ncbi:hypothetical protein DFH08DRAFT_962982 [Mycena albidolilacea]|uniref:Transmembrane protein n=1 Tax=Mycena albidolilacea TaxID=1033008 RepID=A0AAD7EQG4_9AGAR|nr:hypothetical protein DFH08DRAFT_962982 [Mycena albidolilacea]